jgi:uncharacterized membrane protein YeaQ/YmgE (transglycosylase-associated protein family)
MIGWIVIGLLTGLLASRLKRSKGDGIFGEDFFRGMVLATCGAFAGGIIHNVLRSLAITELTITGGVFAMLGAITFLLIFAKAAAARKRAPARRDRR